MSLTAMNNPKTDTKQEMHHKHGNWTSMKKRENRGEQITLVRVSKCYHPKTLRLLLTHKHALNSQNAQSPIL